jgi:hypothetical protein
MFEDPVFIGISVGVSIAVFVGSLIAIPVALIRLPEDYLVNPPEKQKSLWLAIAKNALGVALLAIGIAMLVLPGQGVLMIIAGLTLVDFPGRHKWIRKLMTQDKVQRAVTAIRKRAGKPPLRTE